MRPIVMILKQFYLNCLAHASYLVGDELTRTAAVPGATSMISTFRVGLTLAQGGWGVG